MTVKQKRKLARILAAAVLFVVLYFIPLEGIWRLFAYLVPYLVVGWDILESDPQHRTRRDFR